MQLCWKVEIAKKNGEYVSIDTKVEEDMQPKNLKIEVIENER